MTSRSQLLSPVRLPIRPRPRSLVDRLETAKAKLVESTVTDPNCSSTPWWLPIVTGGLGLGIAAVKWLQTRSMHPKLRDFSRTQEDFDRRLKSIESQEADVKRRAEIEAVVLGMKRRGKVQ